MQPESTAYVGLGSNLQQPLHQLLKAFDALSALPRTQMLARSSLYRSAPVGKIDQPDFVNAVAALRTGLAPGELLQAVLQLEAQQGRVRSQPNAPRTLDLDLLLFDAQIIHQPGLDVPHPRMHERAFVLRPLLDIAPAVRIPGRGAARRHWRRVRGQRIARTRTHFLH